MSHYRQDLDGRMISAMTGTLLLLLLVLAIVAGLEAQHRHARRLSRIAPTSADLRRPTLG